MLSLRRLVTGLSLRSPGFSPIPVRVGFGVVRVTLGWIYFREDWFSHVSIIPPMLRSHLFVCPTYMVVPRNMYKAWTNYIIIIIIITNANHELDAAGRSLMFLTILRSSAIFLNQLIYVLTGYRISAPVLLLYCFSTYLFLFCFFSVLSCVFVLLLCWLCNWHLFC